MTDTSLERDLVVRHAMGLHARPAVLFVRTAKRFKADIDVICRGDEANAKSILSVLSLGVNQGMQFTVRASGPDAAEALDAICDLVARDFEDGGEPDS
jgi:phosphocarrier protein HPr